MTKQYITNGGIADTLRQERNKVEKQVEVLRKENRKLKAQITQLAAELKKLRRDTTI